MNIYTCSFFIKLYLFVSELENPSESGVMSYCGTTDPRSACVNQVNVECIEMQSLTRSGRAVDCSLNNENYVPTSVSSMRHQVATLMKVRFLSERRMKGPWIMRTILPIIVIICGILFNKSLSTLGRSPDHVHSLPLAVNQYLYVADDRNSWTNPELLVISKPGSGMCLVLSCYVIFVFLAVA